MLRRKEKRAQSTLEYILILTAIVGLIIYAATNWIDTGVEQGLKDSNTAIKTYSGKVAAIAN